MVPSASTVGQARTDAAVIDNQRTRRPDFDQRQGSDFTGSLIRRYGEALRLLADVEAEARRRIAPGLGGDFGRQRRAIGDVGDHDVGALGRQRLGIVPPYALGAAGHDRGASCQSRHVNLAVGFIGARR
jgi:hypothetical protein